MPGVDQTDLEDLSSSPKRTTTEEGTVEERSIDETIKGDQYAQLKSAVANEAVPWGIRVARIKPGGTV